MPRSKYTIMFIEINTLQAICGHLVMVDNCSISEDRPDLDFCLLPALPTLYPFTCSSSTFPEWLGRSSCIGPDHYHFLGPCPHVVLSRLRSRGCGTVTLYVPTYSWNISTNDAYKTLTDTPFYGYFKCHFLILRFFEDLIWSSIFIVWRSKIQDLTRRSKI